MKRTAVAFVLFFSVTALFAQESRISQEMSIISKELKIEGSQREQLSKILINKHNDLEAISLLRKTDERAYRHKRRSVYKGTEISIQLILLENQQDLWQAYKVMKRKENAEMIKTLRARNASKQDLLDAQYGIANE